MPTLFVFCFFFKDKIVDYLIETRKRESLHIKSFSSTQFFPLLIFLSILIEYNFVYFYCSSRFAKVFLMASISTQKAPSSSLFSSSTSHWKYDVFLNFRGEDTRNSFADHLYAALKQKGIETFRDEEKLETGKSVAPALLQAIEESRFAIVILSRNYASSTWCLDELVKIIECMKEKKMIIFPIFYHVDPSYVRKQTGTFSQAFAKHIECFKDCIEKVQKWRFALREVTNIKGWHTQDR